MGAFEYRQAEEIRDAFARHGVRYLFIGKSGAILLGFPDTTQDADLFVEKEPEQRPRPRGGAARARLRPDDEQAAEIERGKDFVQLKNGPFDLDLVFAPDGIERFEDAWRRRVEVEGFPVCHLDDIIASKEASNRARTASRSPASGRSASTGRAAAEPDPRPAGAQRPWFSRCSSTSMRSCWR